jgi:hypothetical protein
VTQRSGSWLTRCDSEPSDSGLEKAPSLPGGSRSRCRSGHPSGRSSDGLWRLCRGLLDHPAFLTSNTLPEHQDRALSSNENTVPVYGIETDQWMIAQHLHVCYEVPCKLAS